MTRLVQDHEARGRNGFQAVLRRTAGVQKTSKGAPAYSRFVNRKLGRYLAAAAYVLRRTPDQVTLVSACFSYAAVAAIALVRPSPALAVAVTVGLVFGYAFDSADGQLARLRGGGSTAGEWLDHMVDCVKISALHLAVLISFYRFFELPRPVWLLLPAAFGLVATTFFFGTILTDQLRRAHRVTSVTPVQNASVRRSLAVLPTDYGLLCLVFLSLGAPNLFRWLYGLMFVGTAAFLCAVTIKWYLEIRSFRIEG